MGTRNLTCVVMGGEFKVAQYGQWDGYPSGQGVTALQFLHDLVDNHRLEKFKQIIKHNVTEISEDTHNGYWVEAGADPSLGWVSMDISDRFKNKHPELSRDTGAKILDYILENKGGEIKLSTEFAADSLFCEWCYVIDLDKDNFEVYKGFNTQDLDESEKFYHLTDKNNEYRPVALSASFPFNNLPSSEDFVNHFKQDDDD
jgi:hypothetical protein